MNHRIVIGFFFLLTAPAWAGPTFDAYGNLIDDGSVKTVPNPALNAVQNRNASTLGGLVNQTPEYQQGHALRVEAIREQEAYQRERFGDMQPPVDAQGRLAIGHKDQAKIENLNNDLHKRDATATSRRATRDELRQIYGKYGIDPIGPEPPVVVHQSATKPNSEHLPISKPPVKYSPDGFGNLKGSDGSKLRPDGFGNYRERY